MKLLIVKKRIIWFSISALLFLLSIFSIFGIKLNLGIDMTGGTQAEFTYTGKINLKSIKTEVETLAKTIKNNEADVINNVNIYKVSGEEKLVILAGFDGDIESVKLDEFKSTFRDNLKNTLGLEKFKETKYTNIGKSFGDYIKETAKKTLFIAIISIALYIAYAFSGSVSGIGSFAFAIITVVTLFHDVVIATGIYVFISQFFTEFKIDTFFVTALLTILGYSINDTIVIFDRIRANLKKFGGKSKNLEQIINMSVTETVRRSIYTSLTTLFALFAIFFFGPETVKGFVLVMICGTIVGTYSSIFIASPLLFEFNKNKTLKAHKEKED